MTVKKVRDEEMKKAALSIRKDVFVNEQNIPLKEEIDQWDSDPSVVMFLDYNTDKKPMATGRFRQIGEYGKIERICTRKFARGKGCGKRIIDAIEKEAKSRQIKKVKLNARITAIPFYEKLGYYVTSEEFLDAGYKHKEMQKEL